MNEFDYQRMVIAYHGCDASVVEDVLTKQGTLKPSENRYDWLGKGIYFWEHGPQRAWAWANRRARNGSRAIKKPAVLGAILHLGACFDLLDTANTNLLTQLFPEFEKASRAEGRDLPVNEAPPHGNPDDLVLRYLDCAVINWALSELEKEKLEYDTVRCSFSEGGPVFPGSKIFRQSHIQIAVRNPEVIVGFFLPAIDFDTERMINS